MFIMTLTENTHSGTQQKPVFRGVPHKQIMINQGYEQLEKTTCN